MSEPDASGRDATAPGAPAKPMIVGALVLAGMLGAGYFACSRTETVAGDARREPAPVATAPETSATSTLATASAPAVASVAPETSATAPLAAAVAPDAGATTAKAPRADAGAANAAALVPARTKVEGTNFALDVATPGCRVGAECTVSIRLTATGGYHVNKEYPYKFLAQAAPTHEFKGKGDPNTFSKQTGDFREEGEKAATMTVRLVPTKAGEAKVAGTYKLSVCSDENCQIEAPKVELAVPVM